MKLFEYAIILNEKEEKGKVVDAAQLLVAPTNLLAKDQAQAYVIAAREIPAEHMDHLDRVVIAIRPF